MFINEFMLQKQDRYNYCIKFQKVIILLGNYNYKKI